MRNALARLQPKQRPAVVALLKTIFAQETAEAAHAPNDDRSPIPCVNASPSWLT